MSPACAAKRSDARPTPASTLLTACPGENPGSSATAARSSVIVAIQCLSANETAPPLRARRAGCAPYPGGPARFANHAPTQARKLVCERGRIHINKKEGSHTESTESAENGETKFFLR